MNELQSNLARHKYLGGNMKEGKISCFKNTARWFASLSNGENAVEGVGKFAEIKGEISPWQKLQAYLKENNLTITGMQIRTEGKVFTLPSNEPKFGGEIPLGYKYFRKVAADMMSDNPGDIHVAELYICIQAIYKDFTVSLWVDEFSRGKNSWVSVDINK